MSEWLRLLPLLGILALLGYLTIRPFLPKKRKQRDSLINLKIQKENPKVVNEIDIEDLNSTNVCYCRCWRSKTVGLSNGWLLKCCVCVCFADVFFFFKFFPALVSCLWQVSLKAQWADWGQRGTAHSQEEDIVIDRTTFYACLLFNNDPHLPDASLTLTCVITLHYGLFLSLDLMGTSLSVLEDSDVNAVTITYSQSSRKISPLKSVIRCVLLPFIFTTF